MPNNVIFLKMQKSLFFINIDSFKKKLVKNYGFNPSNLNSKQKYIEETVIQKHVKKTNDEIEYVNQATNIVTHPNLVLDFSAVNYIDTSAVNSLLEVKKT